MTNDTVEQVTTAAVETAVVPAPKKAPVKKDKTDATIIKELRAELKALSARLAELEVEVEHQTSKANMYFKQACEHEDKYKTFVRKTDQTNTLLFESVNMTLKTFAHMCASNKGGNNGN
jgi:deoxyadenosine/deoxycytidine kinase